MKPKPLTPTSARNAALINQLATPGLGTLMVGKIVLGLAQLAVAVVGFCLVLLWFVGVLRSYYGQISGQGESPAVAWLGWAGAGLFLLAWIWSLITSIGLMRAAQRAAARSVPPRISP